MDRGELADTCLRLADDRQHTITPAVRCALRMASDALRSQPSVEGLAMAFNRQTANLAFILNRVELPPAWFDKFDRELQEDRQIASLYEGREPG